jgi:hypothetical protein
MFERLKKGAQKAGIQATAFAQSGTTKLASGSRDFVQGFSLPGEAEKAANILNSFLGVSRAHYPKTCIPIHCYFVQLIQITRNLL